MLRRLILSFSLIFLFALGQQGAVLHEISHYADINPSSQQQDKAPHSSVCDKCLSYGELASALSVSYFAPPILTAGYELTAFSSSNHPSNTLLSYLARAPPLQS
ncbi:MAG: hypothetical protein WC696_00145 [Candidatus Methylopumilus sp.]|jgi:hypothetical protein